MGRDRTPSIETVGERPTSDVDLFGSDLAVGVAGAASSLRRFSDEELADLGAEPMALRAFIDRWRGDLGHRDG